ncbi:MAG TPA: tetraacyldisaccharide 4'-kinase, partial [Syntrophorhabdaceae bacterium]|nr:tetraacyldisaccharide 4'-kinase [Syntrophorhabdaceae bacterium]
MKVWRGEAKYMRWILYVPLACLSFFYQTALYIREYLYRSGKIKIDKAIIPVISVGNITLGGTGKTPLVDKLSRRLKEEGLNPGIITRGYGRTKKGVFSVDPVNDNAREVGDEALMLARKTHVPVIVGSDRPAAIDNGISRFGIDIAILDDGFQVRNLEKDLELLVLNAQEPLENHELFPLGPYREPLLRVRDAHAIFVNKGDLDKNALYFTREIPKFRVRYKPLYLYDIRKKLIGHYRFMNEKRVTAFAGLGDNRSFYNLLGSMGANIVHTIDFPDHHRYTEADLLKCASHKDAEMVVTTEKDAIKIAHMDVPENMFFLCIEAEIENEDSLVAML